MEFIEDESIEAIKKIDEFVLLDNPQGVNRFRLYGDTSRRPDQQILAVGVFATSDRAKRRIAVSSCIRGNLDRYFLFILGLEVSRDMPGADFPDNPLHRLHMEEFTIPQRLPSHVLALGRANKKNVVALFSLIGVSPQTALGEIQEGLQSTYLRGQS